jgi:hypothetical protein
MCFRAGRFKLVRFIRKEKALNKKSFRLKINLVRGGTVLE